jgi:hypothetical protein
MSFFIQILRNLANEDYWLGYGRTDKMISILDKRQKKSCLDTE